MRVLTDTATALDAVFTPRRIALVGASDRDGSVGALLWRNLASFPGEVVPVSASATTVGGIAAVTSLREIDGPVDLAVIVVPAAAVPGVLDDAGATGVPAAVVISGGFAETGPDGARLQRELMAAARRGGVRVVGPNCFGVQNCDLPLNASIAVGTPPGGGGISLVTQSGAYGMAMHTLGVDEQLRFAKVFAAGNKADLTDADLVRHLGADPATQTLCLLLESLPDGRAFTDQARLITPHTPVLVAKSGRSAAGARAAWSHTASLAGSERVWRGALAQAGVILARSGLEMMDAARALTGQAPPAGPRVGIVTNSGGTGVELADLLADEDLTVPELSAPLRARLRALLPPHAATGNPVDMTPVWPRFPELYPALVDLLARCGEVDAVVAVLLQRSADEPVARAVADAVLALRADGMRVPVYVCWAAGRAARPGADLLNRAGVPCFEWPQRTARAVGLAARYGALDVHPQPDLTPLALDLPDGPLDPAHAARVLADAGIATVPGQVCADPEQAVAVAQALGYPVVAKIVHPDVVHKSDTGGVRLNLRDATAVRTAATDLLGRPGARVLVQRHSEGVEVVIGGLRDPQFGPVVLVGLGGVLVEVLDDTGVALAPLHRADAHRLLTGLRGHALLTGHRGRPPVDLDALAAAVCAVGDLLAGAPAIAELDLNPVLATPTGCVALDWRIRVENLPAQVGEPPRASSPHTEEL